MILRRVARSEIERKFLVRELPSDVHGAPAESIEQGYLAIDDDVEVRVRRREDEFFLTIKKGSGQVRAEEEVAIDGDRFTALWELTEGRRIEKSRRVIDVGGGTQFEVDVYSDELNGLITVEAEFESEEAAERFQPPAWFGPEVTEDGRFKNRALACDGLPADALVSGGDGSGHR
jgi:adenylate cyclase